MHRFQRATTALATLAPADLKSLCESGGDFSEKSPDVDATDPVSRDAMEKR